MSTLFFLYSALSCLEVNRLRKGEATRKCFPRSSGDGTVSAVWPLMLEPTGRSGNQSLSLSASAIGVWWIRILTSFLYFQSFRRRGVINGANGNGRSDGLQSANLGRPSSWLPSSWAFSKRLSPSRSLSSEQQKKKRGRTKVEAPYSSQRLYCRCWASESIRRTTISCRGRKNKWIPRTVFEIYPIRPPCVLWTPLAFRFVPAATQFHILRISCPNTFRSLYGADRLDKIDILIDGRFEWPL